jgi:hypothetical protein
MNSLQKQHDAVVSGLASLQQDAGLQLTALKQRMDAMQELLRELTRAQEHRVTENVTKGDARRLDKEHALDED